jgi:ATP-dependent DNA helicase RecG
VKTEEEIKNEINLGEDSSRQFKVKLNNAVQIAIEMCAMSNSNGGIIYIGVKNDNTIEGLTAEEIGKYNLWISDGASQLIRPSIYPQSQTIRIDNKIILLIDVPKGVSKPYCDNEGVYWVKIGSDKRKASPQELLRLFQESSQIYLDESPTSTDLVSINNGKEEWNVDLAKFYSFFEKNFGKSISDTGLKTEQILVNMNLAKEGKLTFGGLLLFGNNVQGVKPFCIIRAISYNGNEISGDNFIDKRDCIGTIEEQYRSAMTFLKNNLSNIQVEESFNSKGTLEINEKALEEAVVNAILHRDYSKNAVIRLLIFKNRVELISPGSLPNHLNVENIKNGNSVMRNPILTSFGTKILPYSGIGSGVPRIVKNHPNVELINDKEGEQFTVIMKRILK